MYGSSTSLSTVDSLIEKSQEDIPLKLINTISILLGQMITRNKNKATFHPLKDSFLSSRVPSMSIEDYLQRIIKYTKIQFPTFLSAIIYIAHIVKRKNYCLSLNNIYRILITSCFISAKFNEDGKKQSSFYSKVGGVTQEELEEMEYEFLILNDYSFYINELVYEKYNSFITLQTKCNFV